jgi:ABC-type glycerol-3-phosphate transport system permease component
VRDVQSTSEPDESSDDLVPTPDISWRRILLIVALIIGGILMIAPFYWMLITSFKTRAEIAAFPPTWFPQEITFTHWRSLTDLDIGSFVDFFRNSIFVTGTITALTLFTSSITGYVFAKFDFPFRDKIFLVVLSMMIVPFSVTLIPLYGMMAAWGWLDNYLALIVPVLFNPFGIFLMRQFMRGIPDELLDAARLDGASEFGIFFRIVLPLSSAPLAALAIFVFTQQWDNFLWPLVILESPELYTLPLGLAQFRGRTGLDVGPVAAGSVLSVLPVIVVYLFAQRQFIEGITLSGVKQ